MIVAKEAVKTQKKTLRESGFLVASFRPKNAIKGGVKKLCIFVYYSKFKGLFQLVFTFFIELNYSELFSKNVL